MSFDPAKEKSGWYGAGFASLKSGRVPDGWLPPFDDEAAVQEWLDGFCHAHADYFDCAMAGPLEGDPAGENCEDVLLRIAPELYVVLAEKRMVFIDRALFLNLYFKKSIG